MITPISDGGLMGVGTVGARPGARRGARAAWLLASCALSWSEPSAAQDEPLLEAGPSLEAHGFVSQGFILSVKNEYLARAKSGSFEFSEVGLNLTSQLTDKLRAGMQLFAHDLGPIGNFTPQLDWFYLDYRAWDWLGIRAGRTKMPFGLYNEINDIDVARVPILLPQSIYQVDHREFLLAQTGAELYGDVALGAAGALEYRAYGGTLSGDAGLPPPPGITVSNPRVPYVYGGRLMWSTPVEGLAGGASYQALRLDSDVDIDPVLIPIFQAAMLLPADVGMPLPVKFSVRRWIASLQYTAYDLDLSAEYSRWTGEFYSRAPALFTPHIVNERYYAMASYRVSPWFTPGVYYSALFDDVSDRHKRGGYQHDLALTTRFDLNEHWLLKLEGHIIRGSGALDNRALNNGVDRPLLEQAWGLFLIKTTAYF